MEITNKGEATAKRSIKALTDSEFIEKVQGKYRLKNKYDQAEEFEEREEVVLENEVSEVSNHVKFDRTDTN